MEAIPTPGVEWVDVVPFKKRDERAVTPTFATEGSAGFDLSTIEDIDLSPGSTVMARTGLVIAAPEGTMMLVAPRSSTWRKWGVQLGNTIGIVDGDFCGDDDELLLCLWRPLGHFSESQDSAHLNLIPRGTRIAQGVFLPVHTAVRFHQCATMGASRGGWGSSNP